MSLNIMNFYLHCIPANFVGPMVTFLPVDMCILNLYPRDTCIGGVVQCSCRKLAVLLLVSSCYCYGARGIVSAVYSIV